MCCFEDGNIPSRRHADDTQLTHPRLGLYNDGYWAEMNSGSTQCMVDAHLRRGAFIGSRSTDEKETVRLGQQ
jgi:hypothetical protein